MNTFINCCELRPIYYYLKDMKKVNIVINPVLAIEKVIYRENETSTLSRTHSVHFQTRSIPE